MLPLVPVVKILKKIGVTGKKLEEGEDQTFKGSDREKYNFSTLAASNTRLLIFFGEENQ